MSYIYLKVRCQITTMLMITNKKTTISISFMKYRLFCNIKSIYYSIYYKLNYTTI